MLSTKSQSIFFWRGNLCAFLLLQNSKWSGKHAKPAWKWKVGWLKSHNFRQCCYFLPLFPRNCLLIRFFIEMHCFQKVAGNNFYEIGSICIMKWLTDKIFAQKLCKSKMHFCHTKIRSLTRKLRPMNTFHLPWAYVHGSNPEVRTLHNTSTCTGGSINSIYDDLFQTSKLNELTWQNFGHWSLVTSLSFGHWKSHSLVNFLKVCQVQPSAVQPGGGILLPEMNYQ